MSDTTAKPGEVTTELRVPLPTGPRRTKYVKWSVRKSIDFPLLSVALRFDLQDDGADAAISAVKVVAGVLGSRPRTVGKLDEVVGKKLSDPAVARLVGTGPRAHVEQGARTGTERVLDGRGKARIRATELAVADAEAIVQLGHQHPRNASVFTCFSSSITS